MTTSLRTIMVALALVLLALILRAAAEAPIGAAFAAMAADPWGIVTLADLYIGFVVIGVVMYVIEDRPLGRLIAILPLPFLGNLWAALWLAFRLARILRLPSRSANGGQ